MLIKSMGRFLIHERAVLFPEREHYENYGADSNQAGIEGKPKC